MPLQRRCPLCTGGRARPVWHDDGLRYVRCRRCGVVFSDVDAAQYAAEQHNVWHEDDLAAATVAFYRTARGFAHEQLLRMCPPTESGRLLDVGCGLGYFVERAGEAGWHAYGCDVAGAWVAHARERVGADRIALGTPRPDLFAEARFDLVTVWDVLEHVHDPLPFLRAIASVLAPGARVFIRTPNLAWVYPTYGIRRHVLREQIGLGPLNHVVYYTAQTLGRALRGAGLEPVAWPVLPPPQVGFANRDPVRAGHRSPITVLKNAHAATADRLARVSGGRLVAGADLDVLAGIGRA